MYVLASVRQAPPVQVKGPDLVLWLESWDGSTTIPLSSGPVRWRSGAGGLEVPPVLVTLDASPGSAGASLSDVSTLPRDVLLPLTIGARDWSSMAEQIQVLRDLTDPTVGMTPDGSFRLVARSPSGVRRIGLVYRGGLEGGGAWSPVRQNVVLDLVAPFPFAQDLEEQSLTYALAPGSTGAFVGGLFGHLKLASSTVLSDETPVEMFSQVPVFPTLTVVNECDSVLIEGDNGLRIHVPGGLAGGEELRIVTDPRARSIRVDGAPAAGRLSRGSRFAPFALGPTLLSVTAPGATSDTKLTLSWRGLHRGLW